MVFLNSEYCHVEIIRVAGGLAEGGDQSLAEDGWPVATDLGRDLWRGMLPSGQIYVFERKSARGLLLR